MADEAEQGTGQSGGGGGGGGGRASGGVIVLNERFEIDPGSPLPDLNTPTAQAFKVKDRRDTSRSLFALMCNPDIPVRLDVLRNLKGTDNVAFMTMLDWGTAYWPSLDRKTMAIIYQRPYGGRVTKETFMKRQKGIGEQEMVRNLISPLISGIQEFNRGNITHRAIRIDNLYYMDEGRTRIVFGDAASAPPGYNQPVAYETIEAGMCHPAGRGKGSYLNDLYALGCAITMAYTGGSNIKEMTDEEIIAGKVEHSSYGLLVGNARMPLPLVEILRGLLCDDETERWNFESLDAWVNGRRLSPLAPSQETKAKRGFKFLDEEYITCRELAMAMSRNWEKALLVIEEPKIETWLRRSLEDKETAAAVENTRALMGVGDSTAGADLALARILMQLDNRAPIRFKSSAFMPDGIGYLMAISTVVQNNYQDVVDSLLNEVSRPWFETRTNYNPDYASWDTNMRDLRYSLRQRELGYGLERAMYDSLEGLPCQSNLVTGHYVIDIRELLPALEAVAKTADPKAWPFDRHIAAYIASRFNQKMENYYAMVATPDPAESVMGMLGILATLQWRLGPEALLDLCAWCGGLLTPVVNGYHSRERRGALEREIPRLVRKGNLAEIFNLLDDKTERTLDKREFETARLEFKAVQEEINYLESDELGRDERSETLGQQTSAVTAVVIALVAFAIIIALRVW